MIPIKKDKVVQPRKTSIEYSLNYNNVHTLTQTISITLEDVDQSILKTTTSSNASSNTSTATAAMALIGANLNFQSLASSSSNSSASPLVNINGNSFSNGENVWKKRNLENSVIIPQETQVKSR